MQHAQQDLQLPPDSMAISFSALPWRISKSFGRDFDVIAGKLEWRDNLKNYFSKVEPLHSCKGNTRTPVMKWAGLPWRQGILG